MIKEVTLKKFYQNLVKGDWKVILESVGTQYLKEVQDLKGKTFLIDIIDLHKWN